MPFKIQTQTNEIENIITNSHFSCPKCQARMEVSLVLEEEKVPSNRRLPQTPTPLAEETYQKRVREYWRAVDARDRAEVWWLEQRFLLAGRPIPTRVKVEDLKLVQEELAAEELQRKKEETQKLELQSENLLDKILLTMEEGNAADKGSSRVDDDGNTGR